MPRAEDIPECPGAPQNRLPKRVTQEYAIQIVTPMFGGGVTPGNTDDRFPIRQAGQLADSNKVSTKLLVEDLWRNAWRRAAERRYDDAVARLYRAFEALAQVQLREKHSILDTERVPLDRLPKSLCDEWAHRSRDNAVCIGLQDAYRLLKKLGDDLGARFTALGLDADDHSPFKARNRSILAHGFEAVSEREFESLNKKLSQLGNFPASPPDDWRLPTAGGV